MVPSTGGRAARLSEKNELGTWNFTLLCRFMSPKNSMAVTCRCCPWNPSKAITIQVNKAKPIKKFLIILVKHRDALTADPFEKFSSHCFGEFWIRSFNCQEKGVVRNTLKRLEI